MYSSNSVFNWSSSRFRDWALSLACMPSLRCILYAASYKVLTWMRGNRINPIMLYHSVAARTDNPILSGFLHHIDPEVFVSQLTILSRVYTVVPLDDLVAELRQGVSHHNLAAITFDDAYRDVLSVAEPALRARKIHATVFVPTVILADGVVWRDKLRFLINSNLLQSFLEFCRERDDRFSVADQQNFYHLSKNTDFLLNQEVDRLVDQFLVSHSLLDDLRDCAKDLYLSKEDLRGLDPGVISIGNHSHHHYVFSSLTYQEQKYDLELAEDSLCSLGVPLSNVFSVPFGGERDYNADTLKLLKDFGFHAYLLSGGSTPCRSQTQKPLGYRESLVALRRFMPRNELRFLSD